MPTVWAGWRRALPLALSLSSAFLAQAGMTQAPYWPREDWRTSSPEAQGVDSAQLALLFDAVRAKGIPIHGVVLVRNGYLVLDAYFDPFPRGGVHDLASVTKSVMSTLTGIAVDKGYVESVDQRVMEFFPDRATTDRRWNDLTVRHLLTMTSGFCEDFQSGERQLTRMRLSPDWIRFLLESPFVSDPGERFAYCSCASNLLSAVLTQATGMKAKVFAERYLFGPLGIRDVIWPDDPQGNSTGWGDSYLRPVDMAKLGYLYLQRGVWDGKTIVSSGWIRDAVRSHVKVSDEDDYGYKWWLPKALAGGFEARGRGGQRIVILPSKQTVIVLTGLGRFQPGDVGALLLPAIRSDNPLPENPAANRLLATKVDEAARGSQQKHAVPPLPPQAREITGRTMRLQQNPYGFNTMRLDFNRGDSGTFEYSFYEPMNRQGGTRKTVFGLDGVYRISNAALFHDLPAASRGEWMGGKDFDLELHMAGFNHLFRFRFHFADRKATVHLNDVGVGEFDTNARFDEPMQR